MGAGRQTQTILVAGGSSGSGGTGPQSQRNLGKSELGGVIFGCTHATIGECLSQNLFGLPQHHIKYVQHIRPGMCLFLFNYSGRMLHGIYEAAGEGALNIDATAWTDNKGRTPFPAQVKFCIHQSCSPLPEAVFREAIIENYYSENKFLFELTHAQKNHLIALFKKNMAGPMNSITSRPATQPVNIGSITKVWKKTGEMDDGWMKPKKYASGGFQNAWQIAAPSDLEKGNGIDDVKSYSFHHSRLQDEDPAEGTNDHPYRYEKPDATGSTTGSLTKETSIYPLSARESQEQDFPRYGASIGTQGQSLSVQDEQADPIDNRARKDLDKAARHRNVLEKLQKLDPLRADSQQLQSGIGEQSLGLDISKVDAHKVQPKEARTGGTEKFHASEGLQGGLDTSNGMAVALTPINLGGEWERQARERNSKEQALLKEERERLWVTSSALDINAATAFKRSLELTAATIFQIRCLFQCLAFRLGDFEQMRQDEIDLRRLISEVRAHADQQLERHTAFEKLMTSNALIETSQISMAAEVEALRAEVRDLKSQIITSSPHGQGNSSSSVGSASGIYQLGPFTGLRQQVPQPQRALYILGGLANKWLDSVVAYTPTTNQMKEVQSLLAPRSYAASSVLDEYIYIYGGGDGSSWSNSAERYSPINNSWKPCASMGMKRGSLGGATVRGRIYAVGGGNGAISFDDTECYDPVLGTWIPSQKMHEKRFCVAAAELNGAMYALGGFDGSGYLMSMERFDPREAFWTPLASMSIKRGSLSAAVLNDKLYAIGGFDGRDFLNTVEIYDPRANAWMLGPSMISKRAYGAATVLDDALYVLGGMEVMHQSFETSTMKMERFTEGNGWHSVALVNMINRNFVAAAVF